jgi:alpha-galactosidase
VKLQRGVVSILAVGMFASLCVSSAKAQQPFFTSAVLAPTPPMGWANWNHFFCDYDEKTIQAQADALVTTGLRELGYRYVLIQECIAPSRTLSGELVVDAQRFPHGIAALVNYIHARGLKAGIYTDIGPYTCYPDPHYQGIYLHDDRDVATFVSWGVDLVEADYCNKPADHTGRELYGRLAAAIRKSGRPMLLYICSWGNELPWEWAQGTAQLWRTDADISSDQNFAHWDRIVANFESNTTHAVFSAPNSWNDPDMLEVGNKGLNADEAQSQLSMWAISAAPLWLGNDLAHMDDATRQLLLNPEVIAVDQDPLGAQATRVATPASGLEVWAKPRGSKTSGNFAVLLLNLRDKAAELGVDWNDIDLLPGASVRDLWKRKNLGPFQSGYRPRVQPHASTLLMVSGKFSWRHGVTQEAEWPGNRKEGATSLVPCSECSQGYAIRLESPDQHTPASLTFPGIQIAEPGEYRLSFQFVRNGLSDANGLLYIDDGPGSEIVFPGRMIDQVSKTVSWKPGTHSVRIDYSGEGSLVLDKLVITRAGH